MAWCGRQAAWAALHQLLPPAQPAYSVFRGWQPCAFSLAQRLGWASSAPQQAGEAAGNIRSGEQGPPRRPTVALAWFASYCACDLHLGLTRR